jgi:ketopantoate reductase
MTLIRRAAVLGAGRMGTAVAAHLANAGIPTLLLDLAPTELTADEAKKGLDLSHPQVRNRLGGGGGGGGPPPPPPTPPPPPQKPPTRQDAPKRRRG